MENQNMEINQQSEQLHNLFLEFKGTGLLMFGEVYYILEHICVARTRDFAGKNAL
jgi:hypothetical protein